VESKEAMSTTKKNPALQSANPPLAAMNGAAADVITLAEAAAYLRLSETDIVELVHTQNLPCRLVGSEWRFLKAAIQQWLTSGSPTPQSRKEAQLALAGSGFAKKPTGNVAIPIPRASDVRSRHRYAHPLAPGPQTRDSKEGSGHRGFSRSPRSADRKLD
jgi:excisionase family DNA binding protein